MLTLVNQKEGLDSDLVVAKTKTGNLTKTRRRKVDLALEERLVAEEILM